MKKEYRIKKSSEIDAIFKHRKSRNNQWYGLHQRSNTSNIHFRFALSIGKKYGNAVERNLAKRRLRMIVAEIAPNIKDDVDFVIVVKPLSKMLNYQEMKMNINELVKKSKLTETKHA